jgi:predicted nuclease with RNAse H fold
MIVLGLDLSGPRNVADTCLVVFRERGRRLVLVETIDGADDRQIFEVTSALACGTRIVVGIDAPLSYNQNGGDRDSDRALRRLVSEKGRAGIMPPTMSRMVYLTLRGVVITRLLESLKPEHNIEIVEVHPGACLLLRNADATDVTAFKRERSARQRLLGWLEGQRLDNLSVGDSVTDHFVAACAAGMGAWQWAKTNSVWRFPAQPPEHPYDFAC